MVLLTWEPGLKYSACLKSPSRLQAPPALRLSTPASMEPPASSPYSTPSRASLSAAAQPPQVLDVAPMPVAVATFPSTDLSPQSPTTRSSARTTTPLQSSTVVGPTTPNQTSGISPELKLSATPYSLRYKPPLKVYFQTSTSAP